VHAPTRGLKPHSQVHAASASARRTCRCMPHPEARFPPAGHWHTAPPCRPSAQHALRPHQLTTPPPAHRPLPTARCPPPQPCGAAWTWLPTSPPPQPPPSRQARSPDPAPGSSRAGARFTPASARSPSRVLPDRHNRHGVAAHRHNPHANGRHPRVPTPVAQNPTPEAAGRGASLPLRARHPSQPRHPSRRTKSLEPRLASGHSSGPLAPSPAGGSLTPRPSAHRTGSHPASGVERAVRPSPTGRPAHLPHPEQEPRP
jgi:hypothetical protein